METTIIIFVVVTFLYLVVQFAREEELVDQYTEIKSDVESRLAWSSHLHKLPFGMEIQLKRSEKLLTQAEYDWACRRWSRACDKTLEAQRAMNRAQSIYSASISRLPSNSNKIA